MKKLFPVLLAFLIMASSCIGMKKVPVPGASQFERYKQFIEGKAVAVVSNQTSMVGEMHLVDFLVSKGINLRIIFAPEHGFRNLADAGEVVSDGVDSKTGISVINLYGSHLRATPEDLKDIDVVLFDIQDVGVRFYTYLGTLHYLMEACAAAKVKCVILDRPNPNGFFVDGNILDTAYSSFVGMHPVPIVHGMTVGEYAMMLNGEGWLKNSVKCDLEVIRCRNYTHSTLYELPVRPSPNLPNQNSVYLYPSICFFEGTRISLGRGTDFPFQVYGSPLLPDNGFSFVPDSTPGSKNPPLRGEKCYGTDLHNAMKDGMVPSPGINMGWVIDAYNKYPEKDKFFTSYFDVLSGGPTIREQIQKGMTADQIRESWKTGLEKFSKIREKYLLYE
jgi:uncharacterized protein YbbC (DUF1343 family)